MIPDSYYKFLMFNDNMSNMPLTPSVGSDYICGCCGRVYISSLPLALKCTSVRKICNFTVNRDHIDKK